MKSTPIPIIDITDLERISPGMSGHDDAHRLAVASGDVIAVFTDSPAGGRHLLRILATLEQTERGQYRFNGKPVDLKDYRQCLAVKRQIGYVAPDAAMISNRTLRENLLLTRFYSENDLTIDIDETVGSLCRGAGLSQMLNRRPSVLSGRELLLLCSSSGVTIPPMGMRTSRPMVPGSFFSNQKRWVSPKANGSSLASTI